MTSSDYLIKATVKKLSEKLNKTFFEKIEKAANAAQEAPEIIKKEIESLKNEIIEEAKKIEENEIKGENDGNNDMSSIEKSREKIKKIKLDLDNLNNLLDKKNV